MQAKHHRTLAYCLFIGLVGGGLLITPSKPDLITLSFSALSSSYGSLLTALGGFSITVLALLLGLEALDHKEGDPRQGPAHSAAVRHVAVSLAIACITCFVGANLMSEVNAQTIGIEQRRTATVAQVSAQLAAAGVSSAKVAEAVALMTPVENPSQFFSQPLASARIESLLGRAGRSPGTTGALRKQLLHLDAVLAASGRRLFVVASVSAYLASFLILQSLTFLLRIRFPRTESLTGIQNFATLSIGGILLIKLVYTTSYALVGVPFYASRIMVFVILGLGWLVYGTRIRRTIARLKSTEGAPNVEGFTPLLPYYLALGTCVASMLLLAMTFSDYGPPTLVDRVVVAGGAVICTAFFLVIQLEQPTIDLLASEPDASSRLPRDRGASPLP